MRTQISSVLFVIILLAITRVQAQQESGTFTVESNTSACELNSLYLDKLIGELRLADTTGEQGQIRYKDRIFVIARLGSTEKLQQLNRQRLTNTQVRMITLRGFPPEIVVFAEGEKAAGQGRVEIYLGSKLYLVSVAERDKDICWMCCDDTSTPPKTQGKKNRRRKRTAQAFDKAKLNFPLLSI